MHILTPLLQLTAMNESLMFTLKMSKPLCFILMNKHICRLLLPHANRVLFLALRLVLFLCLLLQDVVVLRIIFLYFFKTDQTLHGKYLFFIVVPYEINQHSIFKYSSHTIIFQKWHLNVEKWDVESFRYIFMCM